MSVSTQPGATQFTRIFWTASSTAMDFMKAITPLSEIRDDGIRDVKDASEIYLDGLTPYLLAHLPNLSVGTNACVIDEDVNLSKIPNDS